jgi:LmbE family N-acetylglucosaminyl deacetylase
MKILIIAAHPDDEVLGCGGTIAKLVEKGYEVFTLILGEGVTSRDVKRKREMRESEIRILKQQVLEARNVESA